MAFQSVPWLRVLDTNQFGLPAHGAAYLIRGERTALVETGTALGIERLRAALRGVSLDYIFVTHVHLDKKPDLYLHVVQPQGARHHHGLLPVESLGFT